MLSPTTESLVPDSAPFPSLYFAFEDGRGIPDTTNAQLVSGLAVRDLKLAQFFHLVTTRSNRPIDSVKLRYSWISANAIRFDRNIGDRAWKDITEDAFASFSMSREDNRRRRRFHIWVTDGNITKAGRIASIDDI